MNCNSFKQFEFKYINDLEKINNISRKHNLGYSLVIYLYTHILQYLCSNVLISH